MRAGVKSFHQSVLVGPCGRPDSHFSRDVDVFLVGRFDNEKLAIVQRPQQLLFGEDSLHFLLLGNGEVAWVEESLLPVA